MKHLVLEKTHVTDSGLIHLSRQTNLEDLLMGDTQITDGNIEKLKKALPRTRILRYCVDCM